MKNHRSRSLLIVLIAIFFVLASILILGIYYIRKMNNETSELLNSVDQAAEVSMLAQSIRLIQEDVQEDIAAFEGVALTSDSSVLLIEDIEDAGAALGLDTRIIKVENIEADTGDQKLLALTVESVGPWAANLSFLKAIESLPHRVFIQETRMSKEDIGWRQTTNIRLHLFN